MKSVIFTNYVVTVRYVACRFLEHNYQRVASNHPTVLKAATLENKIE